MNQGGLSPGGLNFDCKVRRESTDIDDRFIAHIGAMDCFARGLLAAARIINDKTLADMVKKRYSSFDTGLGAKAEAGTLSFEVGYASCLSVCIGLLVCLGRCMFIVYSYFYFCFCFVVRLFMYCCFTLFGFLVLVT